MVRARFGALSATTVLALCVGCNAAPVQPHPPSAAAQPISSSAPAAAPETTTQLPFGYAGGLIRITGSQGPVDYAVAIPRLTRGPDAVLRQFNQAMRASLHDQVSPHRQHRRGASTLTDGTLLENETSRVTHVGARVVAGVLVTNSFTQGDASPRNAVSTVVINSVDAKPILLRDLFTDAALGMRRLADEARRVAPARASTADLADPATDLLNWVPSNIGITVYARVFHAAGDYYPITVPWTNLREVIAPTIWPIITS